MCGVMVGCVVCEGYAFFIKNARLLNFYLFKIFKPIKQTLFINNITVPTKKLNYDSLWAFFTVTTLNHTVIPSSLEVSEYSYRILSWSFSSILDFREQMIHDC